jgi:hypothetical protein
MKTSEQLNELATALAKAQGVMTHALKDSDNPFFHSKYADLAAIVEVIRQPLASNGLCILQGVEADELSVTITTRLMHLSGQWVESALTLKPTKHDPQGVASAATYGRRIGLQALVGVAADLDDDGNSISSPQQKAAGKPALKKPASVASVLAMGAEQQAFNEWITPYVEAGEISSDTVRNTVIAAKHNYVDAKKLVSALLP